MEEEKLTSAEIAKRYGVQHTTIVCYAAMKKDFRGWRPEKAANGHHIVWRKINEK